MPPRKSTSRSIKHDENLVNGEILSEWTPATGAAPGSLTSAEVLTGDGLDVAMTIPHEVIAERAYAIYLARNGAEGDGLNDWLEAEQQLKAEGIRQKA